MTDTPEQTDGVSAPPPPPPAPLQPPQPPQPQRPNRLYAAAAWVGITAGAVFIVAAIVAAATWQTHPYWELGVSFGGFHVVYGIIVYAKHGG